MLCKFIVTKDVEDDPNITEDDDYVDYIPSDGEVSDVNKQIEVEEELPAHEYIDEAGFDEVDEQKLHV